MDPTAKLAINDSSKLGTVLAVIKSRSGGKALSYDNANCGAVGTFAVDHLNRLGFLNVTAKSTSVTFTQRPKPGFVISVALEAIPEAVGTNFKTITEGTAAEEITYLLEIEKHEAVMHSFEQRTINKGTLHTSNPTATDDEIFDDARPAFRNEGLVLDSVARIFDSYGHRTLRLYANFKIIDQQKIIENPQGLSGLKNQKHSDDTGGFFSFVPCTEFLDQFNIKKCCLKAAWTPCQCQQERTAPKQKSNVAAKRQKLLAKLP